MTHSPLKHMKANSNTAGSRPAIRIYTAAEVMDRPMPGWLVDGIVPEAGLVMLYGQPGLGKTFVALGIAKSVVSGEPWLGRYRVQPGSVLYVAAEGGGGLGKRLEAQQFPKNGRSALFSLDPVYLSDAAHRAALLEALKQESTDDSRLRLIVIDTLGMSFTGDENSAQDIGDLMRGAAAIRNATGATILLIHHAVKGSKAGKPKGAAPAERGSSALLGALDASMVLLPFDGQMRLQCKKQKEAECFDAIDVALLAKGDSCVVELGVQVPDADISNGALQALRALHEADGGYLRATEWQQSSDLPASTFYKARNELIRKGYVEPAHNHRYLVTHAGADLLAATPRKLSA